MSDKPTVREAFTAEGERWYVVERHDGQSALVKRHGNTEELLTCVRCGVTRNTSVGCQDVEAVARSQFMNYGD